MQVWVNAGVHRDFKEWAKQVVYKCLKIIHDVIILVDITGSNDNILLFIQNTIWGIY